MRLAPVIASIGISILALAVTASAHTITLQNLSQNVVTGEYQYAVLLDAQANVQHGDGFVLYDFPGLTSWSLSGTGAFGSLDSSGTATTSTGPFDLTQTLTSNALTDDQASQVVDTTAALAAAGNGLTFDDPSVDNLTFAYTGSTPYLGAASAVLTVFTSVTNGDTVSVYGSADRSGTIPGLTYGAAQGTIFVPGSGLGIGAAVPLPNVVMSAGAMLGLVSAVRKYRRRDSICK